MRIGELAERAGLTTDTIRFYEKVGLVLGQRKANGYRDFPPETVSWLHHIRTAQMLGFSLTEIARHGEALREPPGASEASFEGLHDMIRAIDARMVELAALRSDLETRIRGALGHDPQKADRN